MKFLPICLGSVIFAYSSSAATIGSIRNLQSSNCLQWDAEGKCTQCIPRTVNINGQCQPVSDLCKSWDSSNGSCTQCYGGYNLSEGNCVADQSGGSGSSENQDPLCIQQDANGNCTGCASRSVLIQGKCQTVNDQCKQWDSSSGACTACYDGYNLNNGSCSL